MKLQAHRSVIARGCQLFLVLLWFYPASFPQAGELAHYHQLERAGYLLAAENGHPLRAFRADEPFIPASTVKLLTAYLCLRHWGEQHRFSTEFFFDRSASRLWVRAGGDPFLVSEELALIAQSLAREGLSGVASIGLDVSTFKENLVVPGATTTDNPYDAVPTALAANFNTVHVEKSGGQVQSAEPQTPMTPVAREIGEALAEGERKRVNIGGGSKRAQRYFAEQLAHHLRTAGITTGSEVVRGRVPELAVLYRHRNTRTLGEVVQGMLKYSTNFIANHLLLSLVAQQTGAPAGFDLAENYLQRALTREFGWQSFSLYDGAGLSPRNRLSATQLVEVLHRFEPWRHLLPEITQGVLAKTGTLTAVRSLAGYVRVNESSWYPFAVIANETVPRELPAKIIRMLARQAR